jgi:hypothetical protein
VADGDFQENAKVTLIPLQTFFLHSAST